MPTNVGVLVSLVCLMTTVGRSTAAAGVGFVFSGAGGRVGQQVALMEALVLGESPSGIAVRPTHISGASAGAISAVALNAILQTIDTGIPNGLTFDKYREMIFSMNSSMVYDDTWEGMARIFTHNVPAGYVLDNTPMQHWIAGQLQTMNYTKFKDLYMPTEITLVNQSSGLDVRLWSTDPVHGELDLLELIVATAAMPIAFSPRTVTGFPGTIFIDGGTGIDFLPVTAMVNNPEIGSLYLLCYNSALTAGAGTLPPKLNNLMLLKNTLAVVEDQQVDLAMGGIDIAAKSSTKSYTYIPTFSQTFSPLSFDEEKQQYALARQWATTNNPTALN